MVGNQPLSGSKSGRTLETGHVLAVELVGTSRFTRDELPGVVTEFQRLVMSTPQVREALDRNSVLIQQREHCLQLVFLGDPLAVLKCALQAANESKRRPNVRLRMGLHSGPIYVPADLTDSREASGEALSGAQLLMTTGREGHILASEPVARAASGVELWAGYVHDLGECEIRPGNRIRLFSLFCGSIGNSANPLARGAETAPAQVRWRSRRRVTSGTVALAVLVLLIGGASAAWFLSPDFKAWAEDRYHTAFPPKPKAAVKKSASAKKKPIRSTGARTSRRSARADSFVPTYAPDPSIRNLRAERPVREGPAGESSEMESDGSHVSSLILNAKGLSVSPGQSIRLLAADGTEIWAGVPQFAASVGGARALDLAGGNPMVLRASGGTGGELTIGTSSAERLRSATAENPFLESGCVILVH